MTRPSDSFGATLILSVASLAFFSSCVSPKQQQEARLQQERDEKQRSEQRGKEHQENLKRIREQFTPKDPTPEDEALTKQRSKAYYYGLIASIRSLDDKVTPADAVGRAAVSENISLMRAWKRAQMAHLARPSAWTAEKVDSTINNLPSKGLLDEATSLVLRHRNGTL